MAVLVSCPDGEPLSDGRTGGEALDAWQPVNITPISSAASATTAMGRRCRQLGSGASLVSIGVSLPREADLASVQGLWRRRCIGTPNPSE